MWQVRSEINGPETQLMLLLLLLCKESHKALTAG